MVHLIRYRDQYGSWVRASHTDVVNLDFADEVYSHESRIIPAWVYLYSEDGIRFIHRARERDPHVVIEETDTVERSTIRKMTRYRKDFLLLLPLVGRVFRLEGKLWRIAQVRRKGGGSSVLFEPFQSGGVAHG